MIRVLNLAKRYPGGTSALENVNLEIERGEFVFITGPSGAGKTTLLRMFLRQELPTEGQILVNGRNVGALPSSRVPDLRRSIGVVFQDFKLIRRKTALDNVAYVLNVMGLPRSEQRRRAFQALRSVGLHHRLSVLPPALSGGEQQRVAIARAVVNEPALLLADEPTGNLDLETGLEVLELLDRLTRQSGKTMVMATHSREVVGVADRLLSIEDARLVERGTSRA